MSAAWWWITGLGAAGVIGLIALFFAAHALFLSVTERAVKAFMWFFQTRIGFGVLVGAAAWWGTSVYQHHIDQQEFDRKTAAFKAQQAQRDKDIAVDAEKFVLKQIAEEYVAEKDSEYALDQFKAALSPDRKCLIGDDAPGLRRLIDGGETVGRDHQGVRKAPRKKVVPRNQ